MLAGRYVTFEIHPFTFDEFCQYYQDLKYSNQELFDYYLQLGGIPQLTDYQLQNEPSLRTLNDIYNTVLVKDVLTYNKIRDIDIFNRILSYVIDNIGHIFSANSITKYLKSENRKVSVDTVLSYLEYCQQAFIIKKVSRFDTIGKSNLKVDEKYYLTDHGFRQAKGFSNEKDIERTLENIIYIELKSRGYDVKIGKVNQREIDFIAQKNQTIEYYQVCYLLASEETRQREFGVYKEIQDNYPKFVLSIDEHNFSQDGIEHRNIIDFLLNTLKK